MFFDVKINMHLFFSGRSEVFTAGKGTSRKLGVNFDEQIRFDIYKFLPSMLNGIPKPLNRATEKQLGEREEALKRIQPEKQRMGAELKNLSEELRGQQVASSSFSIISTFLSSFPPPPWSLFSLQPIAWDIKDSTTTRQFESRNGGVAEREGNQSGWCDRSTKQPWGIDEGAGWVGGSIHDGPEGS